jgi:uncharacterized membrane protein
MASFPVGRILFAVGLAGLGVLSLIFRDFAMNWQPVPDWVPVRAVLASLSGAILLAGGVGVLVRRTAAWSAGVLAWFALSWLALLQLPRVVAHPVDAGVWLGFAENTLLVCGGWSLFVQLAARDPRRGRLASGDVRPMRLARVAFALSLPVIGLSHFVYASFTAAMVPAWLPFRLGLAYLTGAAHMAAGVALLCRIMPRTAAMLEAAMITTFVVLLHAPGVAAEPGSRLQWTMLAIAAAYAGAAWSMAAAIPRGANVSAREPMAAAI